MFISSRILCMVAGIFSKSKGCALMDSYSTIEDSSMAAKDLSVAEESSWEVVENKCIFCNNKYLQPEEDDFSMAIECGFEVIERSSNLARCLGCGQESVHLLCLFKNYHKIAPSRDHVCLFHFKYNIARHIRELFMELTVNQNAYMKECLSALFLEMDNDAIVETCGLERKPVRVLNTLNKLGNEIYLQVIADGDLKKMKKINFIIGEIQKQLKKAWTGQ